MKGYKAQHAQPIKQGKAHSKTKKTQKKKSLLHFNVNKIKNKIRRNEILQKRQNEVKKVRKIKRKDEDREKFQPLTTEDKREIDENFVLDDDNEELQDEEDQDEFKDYFQNEKPTRILLTTSYRPSRQMFDFLKDIKEIFGVECHYWQVINNFLLLNFYTRPRRKFTIDQITDFAKNKEYTDMLMFREDKHKVNELIMTHLPDGPTAIFQVSNIKLSFDIQHHARISDHFPELILNHFNTKVGRRLGRFFASLFPQNPEFKGRRVVTFHNQRDFIFFRHHRYMFQEEGEKAALQEIGPKFTLRLKSLKRGGYSSNDIEFEKHDSIEFMFDKKLIFMSSQKFNRNLSLVKDFKIEDDDQHQEIRYREEDEIDEEEEDQTKKHGRMAESDDEEEHTKRHVRSDDDEEEEQTKKHKQNLSSDEDDKQENKMKQHENQDMGEIDDMDFAEDMLSSKIEDLKQDVESQELVNDMLSSKITQKGLFECLNKIGKKHNLKQLAAINSGGDKQALIAKTQISMVLRCLRNDMRNPYDNQYIKYIELAALKIIKVTDSSTEQETIDETCIWDSIQKIHTTFGSIGSAILYSHLNFEQQKKDQKLVLMNMEYLEPCLLNVLQDHKEYVYTRSKPSYKHIVPLKKENVLKIMKDLLGSLFLMHLNGIVHMDIKTQNIMYHQKIDRWVFIDFGAGEQYDDSSSEFKQNLFGHTCTPSFCPREMTRFEKEINPQGVDIWALGIVFLKLILEVLREKKNDQWGQLQDEIQQKSKAMTNEYNKNYQLIDSQSKQEEISMQANDEFYELIEKVSKRVFLNMNEEDLCFDFGMIRRGVNHLGAMLQINSDQRINIFELAIELNLPQLSQLIKPQKYYKIESNKIEYPNGCIFEGKLEENKRKNGKLIHKGNLYLNWLKTIIYDGQWQDDLPDMSDDILVYFPRMKHMIQQLQVKLRSKEKEIICTQLQFVDKEGKLLEKIDRKNIQQKCNNSIINNLLDQEQLFQLFCGQYYLKSHNEEYNYYNLKCNKLDQLDSENSIKQFELLNIEYISIVNEVIYSQRVAQNLLFGIKFNFNQKNKVFYISKEIKYQHQEDPLFFYEFLSEISQNCKLIETNYDKQINYLVQYMLFIIKQCNFIKLFTEKIIHYDLTLIQLPLQNINDSNLINLVTSFKSMILHTINLKQSVLINDFSIRYILDNANLVNLHTLNLSGTSITDFIMDELSVITAQLLYLDISHCDLISASKLQQFIQHSQFHSLQQLDLTHTKFDSLLYVFTNSTIKQIKILILNSCPLNNSELLNSTIQPLTNLYYINLQSTHITQKYLQNILDHQPQLIPNLTHFNVACNDQINQLLQLPKLKYLDISWTQIPYENLKLLFAKQNQAEIIFRGIQHIDNEIVESYIQSNNSCESFDLSSVPIDDFNIQINQFSSLKEIYIIHIFTLSKDFFINFSQISYPNLELLDVTSTLYGDDTLELLNAPSLRTLILNKCIRITDKAINHLSKFQSLKHLELAFTNITDEFLIQLSDLNLKNLKVLSLRECKEIRYKGVHKIIKKNINQLKQLDLSHNHLGFKTLRRCFKIVPTFESRHLINLHCCPHLYKPIPTPIKLIHNKHLNNVTAQYFLSLAEVSDIQVLLPNFAFSFQSELVDDIFTRILQHRSINEIESIDVSYTQVGAMSIRIISDKYSSKLKSLNLAGCKIQDLTLSRLLRQQFPVLTYFNISQTQITKNGLIQLGHTDKLPSLETLAIDYCEKLTIEDLILFRKTHQLSKHLKLTFNLYFNQY